MIKIQPGSFETKISNQIYEGYDRTVAATIYYRELLRTLRPLMTMELGHRNDISRLARTLRAALEARRPRLSYKVGTGRLLALLELFPERCVDRIYRVVGRSGARRDHRSIPKTRAASAAADPASSGRTSQ